jgi:hypothetical protein
LFIRVFRFRKTPIGTKNDKTQFCTGQPATKKQLKTWKLPTQSSGWNLQEATEGNPLSKAKQHSPNAPGTHNITIQTQYQTPTLIYTHVIICPEHHDDEFRTHDFHDRTEQRQ